MPAIRLRSASTELKDPAAAADDVLGTIAAEQSNKAVFGFIPATYDQQAFHDALRSRLPQDTRLITMSSMGAEITNQGYVEGRLVIAGLSGDLEVGAGAARGLSADASQCGSDAMRAACASAGVRRPQDLDDRWGAIVVDDGALMKKEELLIGVHEHNPGLISVGGGAGGTQMLQGPGTVGVDGQVFTDGAAILLFRSPAPWAALRSQWYQPTGKMVELTKVDVVNRRIYEIDGKPAVARLCELLDIPAEYLTVQRVDQLIRWCLATRVGSEYFLRFIRISDDDPNSLTCVTMIQEGLQLEIMKLGDLLKSNQDFFSEEIPRRVANPTGALFFDCGVRRLSAQLMGSEQALSETFAKAPHCAGAVVEFETYCGFMINTTLTSVVFGES